MKILIDKRKNFLGNQYICDCCKSTIEIDNVNEIYLSYEGKVTCFCPVCYKSITMQKSKIAIDSGDYFINMLNYYANKEI